MGGPRLEARDLGGLITGYAVRPGACGLALYLGSYGVIALCDALERVRAVLPH